jgi:hypothetical protein
MFRRRPRSAPAVLVVLAGLFLAAPVAAQSGPSPQREAAEDALADAQRLADGQGVRTGRELTTALLEVARERGSLSRSDREEADRLLARPTDPGDSGVGGPYASSARVLKTCNVEFCVHWVSSSADAPPLANANGCTAPDYVDHMLAALGQSRAVENGQLLWRTPVSDGTRGGDPRTDVYLKELNEGGGGLYGYAATDGGSGRSRPAYMVFDNDYAASEFPRYGGSYELPAEVTAAHEYNHVLQYAYDISQDAWMYESTATWSEEKVFAGDDDYHAYMATWALNPVQPITSASGLKMYGSAIWNHWLEQNYGAATVRRAWERSLDSGTASIGFAPAAYDLAIKDAGGTSFGADFGDFAAAAAEWGGTDSGIHEGAAFGEDVHRETDETGETDELTVGGPSRFTTVNHTGFRLFDIPIPDPGTDPLKLTVQLRKAIGNGATGTAALVGIEGGDVTKVVARTTTAGANTVVTMPGDPSRFDRLTAVVANADVRNTGFNQTADDWLWSRDAEPALLTLTTASPGAGDAPVEETGAPDPTGAAPDPACGTTTVEREPAVVVEPSVTPPPAVTPSPTVSPIITPTPTVTPPPVTSVRLSRNTSRLSTVLRTGKLSLFARSNKAGRLSAKATVDKATAKRLKVGRRTTTAGTGRRTATAPSRLKVTVKLTPKLRAAIKRNRKRALKLKVAVTLVPVDGTAADRDTITLTLKP